MYSLKCLHKHLYVIIVAYSLYYTGVRGRKCFKCTRIPHPRDCVNVLRCGVNEDCVTEAVLTSTGVTVYNVGCSTRERCHSPLIGRSLGVAHLNKRSDLRICSECCTGDYCNNKGCGTVVPKPRGPYCFSCRSQKDRLSCDTVALCPLDSLCILRPSNTSQGRRDDLLTSECMSKYRCFQREVGLNAHKECGTCCGTDFCNVWCNSSDTTMTRTLHSQNHIH